MTDAMQGLYTHPGYIPLFPEYESAFTAPEKRWGSKRVDPLSNGSWPQPQGHPLDSSLISFTEVGQPQHSPGARPSGESRETDDVIIQ